ncbi:MAG: ABC transporter ATP-binding protein [Deltaproteobacteria bacterium]|nr:ABC transporter ATP-binding protein [Deltaproteobacteria bacterium]
MRELIRSIYFFPSVTNGKIFLLLAITVTATLFEGFGVAMLFPVMDFIEKGKDFGALSANSRMWSLITGVFDFLHIPKSLLSLMMVVFGLLMARQALIYWRTIYSSWITESIFSDIRSAGFKWFVKAEIPFYDAHGVGQLINALTLDGVRAGSGIFTLFGLVSAMMIFFIYFCLMLLLSPWMTLFSIVMMGLLGFTFRSLITRTARLGQKVSEFNERIASSILERLNGIRLLKLSSTEEREQRFVQDLSESIRFNMYHISRIKAKMEFMIEPIILLAGLTVLYFSVEVLEMSLAKTGMFLFVLLRLLPYTKDILKSRQSLAGFSDSMQKVQELLEEARHWKPVKGGPVGGVTLRKNIRFEGVSFRYNPGDSFALKDLNILFPGGKMTALVGRSGAGKSTLVDLIPRLREPQEGRITIDDVPIEDFDLKALRRSISFVSQEGFLFNDTIENNIRYSRPEASIEEVREAARMAYAGHFIKEFPAGYDTVVGERGTKLSGGQRQRIVLARALLQRAVIIILDEPTSSLDSESERYIQKAMEGIRETGSVTLIVIAHRLSTIQNADQIIVMDRGRVVECGSHRELIHEDTWYADMARMQALG